MNKQTDPKGQHDGPKLNSAPLKSCYIIKMCWFRQSTITHWHHKRNTVLSQSQHEQLSHSFKSEVGCHLLYLCVVKWLYTASLSVYSIL